ncbi:MAG: DUF4105 domain-containing protein, partial [Flavobacterium sp.]
LDVVYNWGMFDFRTPNFLSKFVKGNLLYYLDVDSFNDFVYNYTVDNREVVEQELNLSYTEKSKIWTEINRQLKGNDRYYTYGFIRNNCTTKVVDVINKVVEKPLSANFPSNNHSYRYILNEGLDNHYFEKLGINLLFGYSTNQQADLMFLPVKLKDGISFDKNILKSEKSINKVDNTNAKSSLNSVYTLLIIVTIALIGVFNKKCIWSYFFITAIFSLFLVAVSVYSNHSELQFNALILFFNPLFIIGLVLKNKKILFFATLLTAISLVFMGLELILVAAPLIVLNLGYIMVLFLRNNACNFAKP